LHYLTHYYFFILVTFQELLLLDHLSHPQFFWQLQHCPIHMVFSKLLFHMFYNMLEVIFIFIFCVWIENMYKTIVTKQTSYDLRVSKINFFVHHLHKKSLTNCIPIMIFSYFSLNMQFLKVNFHFLSFIYFCYFFCYTLFCLKIFIMRILIIWNKFHFQHQLKLHFHFDLIPFFNKC
jgi:hypothetical protein